MTFVDRERELEVVARQLDGPAPCLFVLYGRRRTGKTALLREATQGCRTVFFTADMGSTRDQLAGFSTAAFEALGESGLVGTELPSWEQAVRFCAGRATREPMVLVLDEFQHLVTADPSLPSVLQRLWDVDLQGTQLKVVLCGSYVSFMERHVLGAANPLYGRRTGQLLLQPLAYRDAALFFPGLSAADRMTATGILGGIPAYLQRFDPKVDVATNTQRAVLGVGAPLLDEPRFLMMEELREPQTYFSVCRAVAHGHGRPNEIALAVGLSGRQNVSPYLTTLQEMRLLERRVPVTVRNPERSRLGLYRLADPLFRFWFRFVLPNRVALEAGDAPLVWDRKVLPQLAQHVSVAFEDACREHLLKLNRRGALPRVYDRIGAWWRGGEEVDVVGVADDGALLLAECKWSTSRVGTDVLAELEAKTAAVAADLDRPASRVDLAIFSRVGFTTALSEAARSRGVLLFTVEEVLG